VTDFLVRATIVVFGNGIEVLGDDVVPNFKLLERVLCGDCQNIGEGVIMVVIPVYRLL